MLNILVLEWVHAYSNEMSHIFVLWFNLAQCFQNKNCPIRAISTLLIFKGTVHFSTRNSQYKNFLISSVNGMSFHRINHMVVHYR